MVGWGGGGDWGWGGTGLPSVFSFMSGLFVNYWGRSFSVGWLALWLSLFAELPGGVGKGGGLPSLFTFMFHIFVHYFNIHLPLGWLSGSRSLNSDGWGLSHMFSFIF